MILLKNGSLIDGTGAPAFSSDILLDGARIASIAPSIDAPDAQTVDCTNLTITPGFIDIHSHSDVMVLENDRAKADQGVTFEVVGNCGFSPYPAGPVDGAVHDYGRGILAGSTKWGWPSAAQYLDAVQSRARLCTVSSLVGHGSLRTAHAGPHQGPLEESQLDAMERDLAEAFEAGAVGFSTGLMYAPGSSAPREELLRLLRVTARYGRMYTTHMRSYSFQLIESIQEQLDLARETGVKLQISHLQAVGRANWDKQQRALELLEQARTQGIDVEFDIYPYQAGSTVLTQLLPQWTLDGGIPAMLARLADPASRQRIAEQTIAEMAQRFEDIYVSSTGSPAGHQWVGRNFAQIAETRALPPIECVFRILEEENGDVNMLSFNQSVDNLRQLLSHPLCTVISDGFYVKGRPHPRLYGTFPCLLGEMSRDRQWFPLEQAVHKITGKPATRFQMPNRGVLTPGNRADLVVFDKATIQAKATYDDPVQAPLGIHHVYREGMRISA